MAYQRGIVIEQAGMRARLVWEVEELAHLDLLFPRGPRRRAFEMVHDWGDARLWMRSGAEACRVLVESAASWLNGNLPYLAETSSDGGRSWHGFMRGLGYVLRNETSFSASHEQSHLPDGYACQRLHGHGYVVGMRYVLPEAGQMSRLIVWSRAKRLLDLIWDRLNDRFLNEVMGSSFTSSECICRWIVELAREQDCDQHLHEVLLRETPDSWAKHVVGGGFLISKDYHLSASRRVERAGESRVTGDNYVVRLIMHSPELDAFGFAFDLADMKPFASLIDSKLDHRHLDDVLEGGTSSAHMAKWLYDAATELFPQAMVSEVRVIESAGIWSAYGRGKVGLL